MNQPLTTSKLTLDLPIEGMTCTACSTRLEKVLNRLPGTSATVNFASETAHIEYDQTQVNDQQFISSIEKAGFSVPQQHTQLAIEGMTCAACATRLEKVLSRIEGVNATVNFATEQATIEHPATVDLDALIAAVSKAGFSGYVE